MPRRASSPFHLEQHTMEMREAMDLILDGESAEVVERLSASGVRDLEDLSIQLSLGCAHAILNHRSEARRILAPPLPPDSDRTQRAIRFAGLGILASQKDNVTQYRRLMTRSVIEDDSLALPKLSLALYYQRNERDYARAIALLQEVKSLAPKARLVDIYLVGLYASGGETSRALEMLKTVPLETFAGLRRFLLESVLRLGSLPFGGGVVSVFLAGMVFVPYVGPLVVLVWVLYSLLSATCLRRISTKAAAIPAALSITGLAAYVLRVVLMGRFFP